MITPRYSLGEHIHRCCAGDERKYDNLAVRLPYRNEKDGLDNLLRTATGQGYAKRLCVGLVKAIQIEPKTLIVLLNATRDDILNESKTYFELLRAELESQAIRNVSVYKRLSVNLTCDTPVRLNARTDLDALVREVRDSARADRLTYYMRVQASLYSEMVFLMPSGGYSLLSPLRPPSTSLLGLAHSIGYDPGRIRVTATAESARAYRLAGELERCSLAVARRWNLADSASEKEEDSGLR